MTTERGIDAHGSGFRVRIQVNGRRESKVFPTLELARRFRDGSYALLADGEMVPGDGLTVDQAGRSWLKTRSHLSAYANDRSRWSLHIATSPLGRMPVVSVAKKDVKRFARSLTGAASSRRNVMTLVRSFFASMVEDEVIPANPAADVFAVVDDEAGRSQDEYLLPAEQTKLLDAIPEPERWLVAFAIGTGMRQGEQWNLHLADVDLEKRRAVVRYGGFRKGKLRTPKNGKTRTVDLFGLGLHAAREWLKALPSYASSNPHGLMFPTARGARRQQSKVPAAFTSARRSVGRVHVRWHTLRHACASALVAGWWGPAWRLEEVSRHLGHSSLAVTERYAHLAPTALTEKAGQMPEWSTDGPDDEIPAENWGKLVLQVPKVAPTKPAEKAGSVDQLGTTARAALEAVASGHPHAVRMLLEVVAAIVPDAAEVGPARARLRLVGGGQ